MQKNNHQDHNGEFTDKYTEAKGIAARLIDTFFSGVISLIPEEAASIKEIGCGAGYSTERIIAARPAAKVTGSDIDPVLVEMAQKRNPKNEFSVESVYKLPDADNSYDVVICLEVLEHLEEPEKALEELIRITKSTLIVSTPREPIWCILNMARGKYWRSLGNTPGHINHWSSRGLKEFVGSKLPITGMKQPLPWTIIRAKK